MGAKQSSGNLGSKLREIDRWASTAIRGLNPNDETKLNSTEHCNKLIQLTAKVIENSFKEIPIEFLKLRTKSGLDKVTPESIEKIMNFKEKKQACIESAKFYIQIAHVYAAIRKTLNPEYRYRDENGKLQTVSLHNKKNIPKKILDKITNKMVPTIVRPVEGPNLCKRRVDALTAKHIGGPRYTIGICDINKPRMPPGQLGPLPKNKTLGAEIGIMGGLDELYKDNFNPTTGKYDGMTPASAQQYKKDVQLFYKSFTGNNTVPSTITSFDDIPLIDFQNNPACRRPNGYLTKTFTADMSNNIWTNYAKHIATMMQSAKKNRAQLIGILNRLFSKEVETFKDQNGKPQKRVRYVINPELTDEKLQRVIYDTRNIIIKLYTQCEKDFREGIKLFEAIMEKKEFERSINRDKSLKDSINNLVSS